MFRFKQITTMMVGIPEKKEKVQTLTLLIEFDKNILHHSFSMSFSCQGDFFVYGNG